MPASVTVSGSFWKNQLPVQGLVRFTPSRLWVMSRDGIAWACLAPTVRLDDAGSFVVQVTATDSDTIPWHYQVLTPAGAFRVYIPWDDIGYTLKGLIHEHRVGARP